MTSGETPEMIHANALMLGETGLLLRGASGSGKSALTFGSQVGPVHMAALPG